MTRRFPTFVLLTALLCTVGCSARQQPLDTIPVDKAIQDARSLTNEQLVQRTKDYVLLIRTRRTELAMVQSQLSQLDPQTAPKADVDKLTARQTDIQDRIAGLVPRYQAYYTQMVRRGLSTDDVRID